MPVGLSNPFVSEGITDNFSGSFAKQAEEGRNFNYNRVRTGYGTTTDKNGKAVKGKYQIIEKVVGGQIVGRTSRFKAITGGTDIPVGEFISISELQKKLNTGDVTKGIPRQLVNGQPVLNTIGPDERTVDGGERNPENANVKAPDRRTMKKGFNEHLFSGELIDNQVGGMGLKQPESSDEAEPVAFSGYAWQNGVRNAVPGTPNTYVRVPADGGALSYTSTIGSDLDIAEYYLVAETFGDIHETRF